MINLIPTGYRICDQFRRRRTRRQRATTGPCFALGQSSSHQLIHQADCPCTVTDNITCPLSIYYYHHRRRRPTSNHQMLLATDEWHGGVVEWWRWWSAEQPFGWSEQFFGLFVLLTRTKGRCTTVRTTPGLAEANEEDRTGDIESTELSLMTE